MEPAHLNSDSASEIAWEAQLRAEAARSGLADQGFSARVLAVLPPPRSARPRPWVIPALGAVAGLVLVLVQGTSLTDLTAAIRQSAALAANPDYTLPFAAALGMLAFWYTNDETSAE